MESAFEVEHPRGRAPSEEATGKHADWVSAVDGSWGAAVATGCYDGTARLWTPGGAQMIKLSPPDLRDGVTPAPVTTVCLLPPAPDSQAGITGCVVVAGGHDGVVRSWGVEVDAKRGVASEIANQSSLFVGHEGAVKCVSAAPGGERVASCGHDHTVRVWHRDAGFAFDKTADVTAGRKTKKSQGKRRKGDDGDDVSPGSFLVPGIDEPPPPPEHLAPLGKELVFTGHTDSVSAVAWESSNVVWSGGFDHVLKSWDVETRQNTQSYDVPKAIMGMACVAGGGRVAWCGGGDKAVHMWDPRVGATTGATTSLMSHTVRVIRLAFYEFFGFFFLVPFVSVVFEVSARRRASVMRPHSFPESATTWGTKQSL